MARTVDTNIEILVGEREGSCVGQGRSGGQTGGTNRAFRLRKGGMVPAGAPDCEGISQRVRAGGWKLVWARHNPPFGLKSTSASDTLTLPVSASEGPILVEVEQPFAQSTTRPAIRRHPTGCLKKGGHLLHTSLGPPGTRGFQLEGLLHPAGRDGHDGLL